MGMNFILEELLIHMQVSIYIFLYNSSNDHQKGEISENLTIFLYKIAKIHPAVTLINIIIVLKGTVKEKELYMMFLSREIDKKLSKY